MLLSKNRIKIENIIKLLFSRWYNNIVDLTSPALYVVQKMSYFTLFTTWIILRIDPDSLLLAAGAFIVVPFFLFCCFINEFLKDQVKVFPRQVKI